MSLKPYSPDNVDLIVGAITISGYGEDEFINFEMDEDAYTLVAGVDGENTVNHRVSHNGTLTITLQSTSRSNDILSAIYNAARNSGGAAGIVPIAIKDRNTSTLLASAKGFIKKLPAVTFGATTTPREWVFQLVDIQAFVGGSG